MEDRKYTIEVTEKELGIIRMAVNEFWYENHEHITHGFRRSYDGTKLPLGDIEKDQKEKMVKTSYGLLQKLEEIY